MVSEALCKVGWLCCFEPAARQCPSWCVCHYGSNLLSSSLATKNQFRLSKSSPHAFPPVICLLQSGPTSRFVHFSICHQIMNLSNGSPLMKVERPRSHHFPKASSLNTVHLGKSHLRVTHIYTNHLCVPLLASCNFNSIRGWLKHSLERLEFTNQSFLFLQAIE